MPKPTPLNLLRALATEVRDAFNEWAEGDQEDSPPESFRDDLDRLIGMFSANPRLATNAQHSMLRLSRCVDRWKSSPPHYDHEIDRPPSGFADELDHAIKAIMQDPPRLPKLPTPAELVVQRVGLSQIANMWNLRTPDGRPDVGAVQLELESPGSVLTPEHLEYCTSLRMAQLGFGPLAEILPEFSEAADSTGTPEPPAAPEPPKFTSIEQMVLDGATVDQIAKNRAKLYGTDLVDCTEAVAAVARMMGRTIHANSQSVLNEGGRDLSLSRCGAQAVNADYSTSGDPGMSDQPAAKPAAKPPEPAASQPDPADVEAEVLRLYEEGNDEAAIAHELGITPRRVAKLLKEFQEPVARG